MKSGDKMLSESQFFNFSGSDIEIKQLLFNFLDRYEYFQYKYYPSRKNDGWISLYKYSLEQLIQNDEWKFHYEIIENIPFLLGCRFSTWDSEHFGYKVAFISLLLGGNIENQQQLNGIIMNCLEILKKLNVKFVSARIHGDFIEAIHAFENNGFRYYENIIWPVISVVGKKLTTYPNVRLMKPNELPDIIKLGIENIYTRGHYHCDKNFDIELVNKLYGKLIQSSGVKKDHIVVIEDENQIRGFFIFRFDDKLSEFTGYKYARMYSLALDSNSRGKGIGAKLFEGMMAIAQEMGAEYIDSGYSSKNHISAKLHTNNGFYSVYEEITLHLWL